MRWTWACAHPLVGKSLCGFQGLSLDLSIELYQDLSLSKLSLVDDSTLCLSSSRFYRALANLSHGILPHGLSLVILLVRFGSTGEGNDSCIGFVFVCSCVCSSCSSCSCVCSSSPTSIREDRATLPASYGIRALGCHGFDTLFHPSYPQNFSFYPKFENFPKKEPQLLLDRSMNLLSFW